MGLCISYDRMMYISNSLANTACEQFEKYRIVCPPVLRKNIFTTFAVDNIDHNPSSRDAKDSWHGTASSVTQHLRDVNDGDKRELLPFRKGDKKIMELPPKRTSYHLY